jgi:hypothetical protein
MDVEMQNRHYRDLLFCCNEEFVKVECKEEEMVGKLKVEHLGYDRMKTFSRPMRSHFRTRSPTSRTKLERPSFAMTILSLRCLSARIGLSVRGLP